MRNLYNEFLEFLGGVQHRFTTPFHLAYPLDREEGGTSLTDANLDEAMKPRPRPLLD
jgi:hypothetical protein